jgi:dihydrofolate synthase/folylpolyglutamate synthase
VFLPLFGAHQAENAAVALAAVETFLGMKALGEDTVRDGFAAVEAPGRMELVRRSPSVVLDAAHNPHGARATAQAITEAYDFNPLIGVIGIMADKDAEGLLRTYEPVLDRVIVTRVASTSRGMPVDDLGALAEDVFGRERVTIEERLDDALEAAVALADAEGAGVAGVLVTGSVVLVGEARNLLVREDSVKDDPVDRDEPDDLDPDQ